jgi:hypothetical protein
VRAWACLIVPCSGIGKTYGTVVREGAHRITEALCPETTHLVPLARVVLGDPETQQILTGSPATTIDGCKLACAAKVISGSGGRVAHPVQVIDFFRWHRELKPAGIAELNAAGQKLAEVLAEEISVLVDEMTTEIFTRVSMEPRIVARASPAKTENVRKRAGRALESAIKCSLVANSIKSEIAIEPRIDIIRGAES